MDSNDAKALSASLAAPLAANYGVQLDAMVGEIDPDDVHGLGGHLFWRDWGKGLVGITGSWSEFDQTEMHRLGLEGEYYLDRFTVAAAGPPGRGCERRRLRFTGGALLSP